MIRGCWEAERPEASGPVLLLLLLIHQDSIQAVPLGLFILNVLCFNVVYIIPVPVCTCHLIVTLTFETLALVTVDPVADLLKPKFLLKNEQNTQKLQTCFFENASKNPQRLFCPLNLFPFVCGEVEV